MLKTSTMKPFDKGDIFLGCSYLNDPDDDHKGEGRILQFDSNWIPKGTLYTEGTTYLIVGCTFGPDGTLWGFDSQSHTVVRVSPDGTQQENWKPGRGLGSVSWDNDGNHYFGEYFIGREIWKGTTAAKRPDGSLGDGNLYKYSPDLELRQTFEAQNAPEFTNFKGVTHSTMHPSKEFITYTTETARRLMRYDIVNDRQMDDLDAYPDADPNDKEDKRWFIAPNYMADGRLLCTASDGLRVYDDNGKVMQTIELPGYGWAQVCPDTDQRYALADNIWNGLAVRVDLESGSLTQTMDSGFTAPFRSLAGIATFGG
ncbi:MAG: SMP-30/gluconolactonase/LRE family protein [Gammaproteobacteria bacterium]